MDCKKAVVDPLEEVKKLQDLVRKLEHQNQQLRSKQNHNIQPNAPPIPGKLTPENSSLINDGANENNFESGPDDDELIDIEKLDLSDEESWLYQSPKQLTTEQKALSPYQWVRSDVDDSQNTEIQAVKRGLVNKIEELTRNSSLYSSPVNCIIRRPQLCQEDLTDPRNTLSPNSKLSLNPRLQKAIDTRTFTRPKKRSPLDLSIADGERVQNGPVGEEMLGGGATPPLTDVIDIHTIARLQEESLRQSSPPSTPRRNSVTSSSSQRSALSPLLPAEQDGHEMLGNSLHSTTGNESLNDSSPRALSSRTSSASASPPVSPRGSQYFDEGRTPMQGGKRFLPGLVRPQNGLCPPRGMLSQNSRRLNGPANGDLYGSREQLVKNQRYSVSPVRRVGGTPRSASPATRASGIPVRNSPPVGDSATSKCGNLSRIPKLRSRSSIPTLSRRQTTYEDSWKEGCY